MVFLISKQQFVRSISVYICNVVKMELIKRNNNCYGRNTILLDILFTPL